MKSELKRYIKGLWRLANPKIWVASAVPLLVGSVCAYQRTGSFSIWWFLVAALGLGLIETGKHAINEAVDYYTGVDRNVAEDKITPFSGGRRTIVDGTLTFFEVCLAGFLSMGAAALVGLYTVFFREFSILWIGLAGFFIATFYTMPPLKFIYNGLGELAVGITYGPLIVLGSYAVQSHRLDVFPFLLSIPVGLLITNVLWINQFPDYEADKQGKKRNWVVRLGKKKSLYVFAAFFALSYLYLATLSVFSLKPWLLISLLSLPLAYSAVRNAFKNYDDIPKLIKSLALTIFVYLSTGVLLSAAALLS